MFGLPKVAWHAILAALILAGGFAVLSVYGRSKYNSGRRESELARTDSMRVVMTRAVDSAEKQLAPVLEGLLRENDSLKAETRRARIAAVSALSRAKRAEEAMGAIPDSVIAVTPPEVRALIDSLVTSSASLRGSLERLTEQTLTLQASKDDALAQAARWRSLQDSTRAALGVAEREIRQLHAIKNKPRCGFRCGVVTGALTVGALVATLFVVAH